MLVLAILLVTAWEIYWTYHACWMASKLNDKKKFLFFLVFSLLGIPEIIYISNKQKAWKSLSCPPPSHLYSGCWPLTFIQFAWSHILSQTCSKDIHHVSVRSLRSSIIRKHNWACWIIVRGMLLLIAYVKSWNLTFITHKSKTINGRASRSDFTWNCCVRLDFQMHRMVFIYKQE